MNIVYAKMAGYDWVSTPSDAVARALEAQGHTIALVDNFDYVPQGRFDFVWSPYESATIIGDFLSKKLDIPHFAHIEVIPPWRIFDDCDIENYGLDRKSPDIVHLKKNQKFYSQVIAAYRRANIHTISNQCRLQMHEDLMPDLKGKIKLRYPSIDVVSIEKTKKMYNPDRNPFKVITIARVTEIKRYDLLVGVMNKVQTKLTWTIIGDGPMLSYIKENTTNENVTLDFKGPLWGWQRFYELMTASYMVYAMGGMPPMEAALLGVFPICIEQQPTKHLPEFDKFLEYNFGDSVPIFKYDKLEQAAQALDEAMVDDPQVSLDKWQTVDKFLTGKTNVTPSTVNAQNIVKVFNEIYKSNTT